MSSVKVEVASEKHIKYVSEILKTIEDATKVRGTGSAKRKPEYIEQKINEGKAIIAMDGDKFVGFCYIDRARNSPMPRSSVSPPALP